MQVPDKTYSYLEYGALRAIQSSESNFDIMGKIAGYYVPMLLTIFKCVSYIGFIFVIPVMIITGSIDRFKKYLILIASFQVWPVISSILNMFVDLYSATSFSDLSRAGGVSLSTLSTIENTSDIIVAVASSLQMSVPVISYAFISGGIDAITSFHGNLTAAMNQGSSIASSEILSGNKSFDNENIGNTNNFKTDRSSSYKSDSSLMEYADGSTMRQLTSGKEIYSGGSGITEHQAPFKFDLSSSMQSVAEESARNQASVVEATSKAYTESKAKTIDEMAEVITSIDKHISSGDTLGLSEKMSKNKEYGEVMSNAKQIQKETGSDLKTSIGIALGKMFSASAEYSSSSRDSYQDSSIKSKDFREMVNQLSDLTKDENIQKTLGFSEQSLSKFNESASQTKTLEDRYSKESQLLKSKESSASQIKSNNMSGTFDKTGEVISSVAESLGINERDAINKIQRGDILTLKKANEASTAIANFELEKLGGTNVDRQLNNSSYTEKANNYEGMRERAPQFGNVGSSNEISEGINGSNKSSDNLGNNIEDFESKFDEGFDGKFSNKDIMNKAKSDIETGKNEVNRKDKDLQARGSQREAEVAGKFNVGEKSIDKNIKDREGRLEFTKSTREKIDNFMNRNSDSETNNETKKDITNETAEQIKKDTK
jgi:hypothetical protein